MKIRINMFTPYVVVATALAVGWVTSSAYAVDGPYGNFETLATTNNGTTWSNTITVSPGSSFTLGVFFYLSPQGTTNQHGGSAALDTISSLQNGDGLVVGNVNLTNNDPTDLPTTFTGFTPQNGYGSTASYSAGTNNGSSITDIIVGQTTVPTPYPLNPSPTAASNPAVELYSLTATMGQTLTANTSNTINGSWYLTQTPTTSNGSLKINASKAVSIYPDNEASDGGTDPLTNYLALTLNDNSSAPTPEPASLGLLGLGGLMMMRRRRASRVAAIA